MQFDDILLLEFILEMFCRNMLKLTIGFALALLVTKRALQRHLSETVLVVLCIVVTFCNSHIDQLSQKDNGPLRPPHVQNNVRWTAIEMYSLLNEHGASKDCGYVIGSPWTLLRSG